MIKVMISLDKEVIDRLWQSRRSDSESWNRIVGHLLPAEKASCRGIVAPTRIGTACLIEILGERRECATAMDALVWCLETLVHLDGKFLEQVAKAVRTRSRNHIARSKGEVYPRRPDLALRTRPIADGWHVGANISNREKLGIIRAACKVAGLKFGSDVKFLA